MHSIDQVCAEPGLRPAGWEGASPQEIRGQGTLPALEIARAGQHPLQMAQCLCWGRGDGVCQLLSSWRSPPTHSKVCTNMSPSHGANCHFCVASPRAVVSLRAGTRLSLALQAHPVLLSQLTSQAPGSKSRWLYKLWNSAPLDFKARRYRDLFFLCGLPGAFPSLHPPCPPPVGSSRPPSLPF